MIRSLLIALSFFTSLTILSQEKTEVLNYKEDFYYDSVHYESKWIYYGEVKDLKFFKSKYPIDVVDSLEWINDSTFTEHYLRDSFHYESYSYVRIKDTLFKKFNYYPLNKDTTHPQFSFNLGDTLWFPLDDSYLNSVRSGKHFPKSGYTIYLGDEIIQIGNSHYSCYMFKKESKSYGMDDGRTHSQIIYIDQKKLMPVKLINNYYTVRTDILLPLYSVVYLDSISERVPIFQNEDDLITFKDTSLFWSQEQKKKYCLNSEIENYCECIVDFFQGRINYYDLQTSPRWELHIIRAARLSCK